MSSYRIGICRIMHESNSFVLPETSLEDFRQIGGILLGEEILQRPDRQDEIAGFVEVLGRTNK